MPGGRKPTVEITDEVIKQVEQLSAQGLTKRQVSQVLGIGYSTYFAKEVDKPELREAYKRGGAKGVATITNALFQSAQGGNVASMIFYLKNRDRKNWSDNPVQDDQIRKQGNHYTIEVTELGSEVQTEPDKASD